MGIKPGHNALNAIEEVASGSANLSSNENSRNLVKEKEKKLSSNFDRSKDDSGSHNMNSHHSDLKLDRIKSEPGLYKTNKKIDNPLDPENSEDNRSDSSHDMPMKNKFEQNSNHGNNVESTSDLGLSKMVKGAIEIGKDGYYHANINSVKFEDEDGKKNKSRIMKVRLMEVKCTSENSDKCSADQLIPENNAIMEEEEEDKFEVARREIEKERAYHKREPIQTLHLVASFNHWNPIEMKPNKPPKKNKETEGEGEGDDNRNEDDNDDFEKIFKF